VIVFLNNKYESPQTGNFFTPSCFSLVSPVVYSFVKIYTLSNWTKKFTIAHSKNITNKMIRGVIG
jgi:hypothetical protein